MTTAAKREVDFSDGKGGEGLAAVREMVQACIQCGTCTGSCPNEFAMDVTPRRLWRLVLTGRPGSGKRTIADVLLHIL